MNGGLGGIGLRNAAKSDPCGRLPQIEAQFAEIGEALERQQKTIEELAARLQQVLSIPEPSPNATTPLPPQPVIVPMAERLRDIRMIISKSNAALAGIIERVEI